MKTYKTSQDANKNLKLGQYVVEIDHAEHGRCFIGCKGNAAALRAAMARGPMAEIKAIIGSTPVTHSTDAQIARARVTGLFATAAALEDNAAAYLPAYAEAEKALSEWRAAYPTEAAAEQAESASEEADRRGRVGSGFIARGID